MEGPAKSRPLGRVLVLLAILLVVVGGIFLLRRPKGPALSAELGQVAVWPLKDGLIPRIEGLVQVKATNRTDEPVRWVDDDVSLKVGLRGIKPQEALPDDVANFKDTYPSPYVIIRRYYKVGTLRSRLVQPGETEVGWFRFEGVLRPAPMTVEGIADDLAKLEPTLVMGRNALPLRPPPDAPVPQPAGHPYEPAPKLTVHEWPELVNGLTVTRLEGLLSRLNEAEPAMIVLQKNIELDPISLLWLRQRLPHPDEPESTRVSVGFVYGADPDPAFDNVAPLLDRFELLSWPPIVPVRSGPYRGESATWVAAWVLQHYDEGRQQLAGWLTSDDAVQRAAGVAAVGAKENEAAARLMLHDPDPKVRTEALRALAGPHSAPPKDKLAAWLAQAAKDPDPLIAAEAQRAAATVGATADLLPAAVAAVKAGDPTPEDLDIIVAAKRHDLLPQLQAMSEKKPTGAVLEARAKLDDRTAMPLILKQLQQPQGFDTAYLTAARWLAEPEDAPALIALYEGGSQYDRELIRTIGCCGGPVAKTFLENLTRSDDFDVRVAASRGLEWWEEVEKHRAEKAE